VRRADHHSFRAGAPIARTDAVMSWMEPALVSMAPPCRLFEVGAGQGHLMRGLSRRFPTAVVSGCELNVVAARLAREAGFEVEVGGAEVVPDDQDLIVAFCVLEHVPSPTRFMTTLAARLTPTGRLLLAQPMQDVGSHAIYFVDHLHHFRTAHVRAIGR